MLRASDTRSGIMTSCSGLATLQEGYYDVMLRASDTGRGIMTSCSGLATLGGVL